MHNAVYCNNYNSIEEPRMGNWYPIITVLDNNPKEV